MPASDPCPEPLAVTRGPRHHFFGYYEKTPWDATGRYVLGLETDLFDRPPGPRDHAVVGMTDTKEECAWRPIARTPAWNWQQGAMLQWLPSSPDRLVVYNTLEGGSFAAAVQDVFTGERRLLPRPVYALSPDGRTAFSVNFSRLARTRPGYGYVGLPDPGEGEPAPEGDGVYRMDLDKGECRLIVSIAELAVFRPKPSMSGVEHWVNHVQVNTDGTRIGFLHRWTNHGGGPRFLTRFFTADTDGSRLHLLADDGLTSHYDWRDPAHVLAWARREGVGNRYFLFTDRSEEAETVGDGVLTTDGHCSYSPDRKWILTDTYPDAEDIRTLILFRPRDRMRHDIGRFHAPPGLKGETRCDLHPRWSRDGRAVCIDSAHEGERQMYVIDVSRLVSG